MQTILYIMYDNISLRSIAQSFCCFSMRRYIIRAFLSGLLQLVYILFDDGILLVNYITKCIVINYFYFRLPDGAITISCSSLV